MSNNKVITVENVHKNFVLPKEQISSIKSVFTKISRLKNRDYEKQNALKGISFEVNEGEFLGIVGRNGSGKSTLLKMLAGIYLPSKGSIKTKGKVVPFIELGVGFNPELSGKDNVYLNGAMLGFTDGEVRQKYNSIVEFAELEKFMDQKLKNYSSGMQVRLAFSVATILAESDILLLDEVLAVGDADFQRKCFDYFKTLKKKKKTVVFVSHDMNAIKDYCDRAILIEKGKIIHEGTPTKVANEYTKLFLPSSQSENFGKDNADRWGTRQVEFTNVSIKPTIIKRGKHVKLETIFKANDKIERLLIGFSIKSAANHRILGTNNKLIGLEVPNMEKGETKKVTWDIPNIFNDGRYTVSVSIESENTQEACDWWEDATEFEVFKNSGTGFLTDVDINAKVVK